MNYIADFHWIWYGLGFVFCPRLTIMVMLSIYSRGFIPLPLMILGWVGAFLTDIFNGNTTVGKIGGKR